MQVRLPESAYGMEAMSCSRVPCCTGMVHSTSGHNVQHIINLNKQHLLFCTGPSGIVQQMQIKKVRKLQEDVRAEEERLQMNHLARLRRAAAAEAQVRTVTLINWHVHHMARQDLPGYGPKQTQHTSVCLYGSNHHRRQLRKCP